MYDIESSFDQQILSVPRNRPTVVFTEALDPRIVEAACYLTRFCRPVFLAPEAEVRDVVERELRHVDPNRVEFALSESAFVDIAERDRPAGRVRRAATRTTAPAAARSPRWTTRAASCRSPGTSGSAP